MRLAVFGLGVMPYITSSIIIQLLSTVIPKLEEWRDQGAVGQKKITQTTRYLTVALAVMQSSGLVYAFHGHDSALLGHEHRPDPELQLAARPLHGADPHRGHRLGHVAGRADHPARHRPGHVDPDLRQRRGRHPHRVQGDLRGGRHQQVRDHHRRVTDPAGVHRLHGPGPAPHPGHVRPTGGGPANVRRQLDLHPAQGEPVRRDPDHLRQLGALHPGPALQRRPVELVPELRAQQPDADELLLHRGVLPAHRDVHLLLRVRRLRPAPAGRPDPQAGRLRPGHPARAAHGALLRAHPQPHHRRRRPVPRLGGRRAVAR